MSGDDKMNKHTPIKPPASLLERASDLYDFGAALRGGSALPPLPAETVPFAQPAPRPTAPHPVADATPTTMPAAPAPAPAVAVAPAARVLRPAPPAQGTGFAHIDRDRLRAANFIDPEGPVSGLSEEFRIVKRQLLLAARGGKGLDPIDRGERILICSAHPNEGKTFCAINLALSMATEKDNRVLLVDADFAKPSILNRLGIEPAAGLMDALADPADRCRRPGDFNRHRRSVDIAGGCADQSGY